MDKEFKISSDKITDLIPPMGGCMATDRIAVEGAEVGYMFREKPENDEDSGWTFMAGDESQEYADDPDNWAIYEVNTICNYDPAIVPYVGSDFGTAWGRDPDSDEFEEEEMPDEGDE